MGSGFDLVQAEEPDSINRVPTPTPPVPGSSRGQPPIAALQQEQKRLQDELSAVKDVLETQEALNAKRHEDILALLVALNAKLSSPAP